MGADHEKPLITLCKESEIKEFISEPRSLISGTFATVVDSTGNLLVHFRRWRKKIKINVNESDRGNDGPSEDPGGLGSHAGAPGICLDGTAGSTEGIGGAPDAGTCAAGGRRRGDGGPAGIRHVFTCQRWQ